MTKQNNGRRVRFVALIVLIAGGSLSGAPDAVECVQSAELVEAYDFIELSLQVAKPDAQNPFVDVSVSGTFKSLQGRSYRVVGFCDAPDGSLFRVRFMPQLAGRYTYAITYKQGSFEKIHKGDFESRDMGRRGVLRLDPEHPNHFIWSGTGEHYFWNGTTTYYLMGWQDDAQIRSIIDRLSRLKVNRLRVLVYGRNNDRPWGQPVKTTDDFKLYLNPWPAKRPHNVKNPGFDLGRFDVGHWRKYERLLRYAREKDVIVSVIFFIGGQVLPTPFEAYSDEELHFYRYGVARFGAFSNVTWDLGNEHNFHREYPKWCDWLGPKINEWDPYDHLNSAHNKVYRTPGKTWNGMQLIQRWDAGQNGYMLEHRDAQAGTGRIIPQINEEYGYQDLWEKYPGHRAAETRRRLAWEISMAGCYQTTGETANRGTGFAPDSGGGWVNGRGDDSMKMLEGYGHMVDFFTSFEWWKAQPRNDLVEGGAMCLAEVGSVYAVYVPSPTAVTVRLEEGKYRARWFNPRSGAWSDIEVARGPIWLSPRPADTGDWALLLERDDTAVDHMAPRLVSAVVGGEGNRLYLTFSEHVDPDIAANKDNYVIDGDVDIRRVRVQEDHYRVVLDISPLSEDKTYTLRVSCIADLADKPNRMQDASAVRLLYHGAATPLIKLDFSKTGERTTTNGGSSADEHRMAELTASVPRWTDDVAGRSDSAAVDFGRKAGEYAVDLQGGPVGALKGLRSFTITGWLNCRVAKAGSGGNRIVTTINNGGEGFDLVFLADGSLQIGVNQWPDGVPARSSPGQISADAEAGHDNWRFFAVTYDSMKRSDNVAFYFGSLTEKASLGKTVTYQRGPVGYNTGPLAVGSFNPLTRPGHGDRMFRGIIDAVRVFGSKTDAAGALSVEQIRSIQKQVTQD